jgi:hypothetical protein
MSIILRSIVCEPPSDSGVSYHGGNPYAIPANKPCILVTFEVSDGGLKREITEVIIGRFEGFDEVVKAARESLLKRLSRLGKFADEALARLDQQPKE